MRMSGGVGMPVAVAVLWAARAAFPGYVWFDNSTDTIQVSGQTVVSNAATYEAVFFLPSPRTSGESPRIFGEWTVTVPASPGVSFYRLYKP